MNGRDLFETNARRWWPEVDLSTDASDAYVNTSTRWMYEGWLLASTAVLEYLRGKE